MNRAGRRRYVVPALLIVVGALVLAAGIVSVRRPPPRSPPSVFGQVDPAAQPPGRPAAAGVPNRVPTGTAGVARGPAVPTRLRVPRLNVDAAVVPTGSAGDTIAVPSRISTVGWWVSGAVPGSAVGSTVLVGHVDSAAAGQGALFHLDRLHAGDLVEVAAGLAAPWRYRVTALRLVVKTVGLAGFALGAASPPRLVIITCGGPFDRRTGSYADNVVVFANPVTSRG